MAPNLFPSSGTDCKVCLINPPNVYSYEATTLIAIPPIGLAYIASNLTDSGADVRLLDGYAEFMGQHRRERYGGVSCGVEGATTEELVDRIPNGTSMIGISCMFMHQWPLVREITTAIHRKHPDVPLLLGGEQITGACKHILPEVPFAFACLGEGEDTAVAFLGALARGKDLKTTEGLGLMEEGQLVFTGPRERIRNPDRLPPPAWALLPLERYMHRKQFTGPTRGASMPLLATRGCPYRCTFCSSPQMWTTRWLSRDPQNVFAEM